jgi:hypothetical protein
VKEGGGEGVLVDEKKRALVELDHQPSNAIYDRNRPSCLFFLSLSLSLFFFALCNLLTLMEGCEKAIVV